MSDKPFPQREYTPLCLLSTARSGTNLLCTYLNNHPDVLIHGEIFNPLQSVRDTAVRWEDRPCIPYEQGLYSEYVRTHLFPNDATVKTSVIGFKLFAPHLDLAPEGEDIAWQAIRSIPGLKVILLERKNLLDLVLSGGLARRDQKWVHYNSDPSKPDPLAITFTDLQNRMNGFRQQHVLIRRMAEGCDTFRLTFDDLLMHSEKSMAELQEWLGVAPRLLQPNHSLRRQRRWPRRELLKDFDTLRSECADAAPDLLPFFDEPEVLNEIRQTSKDSRFTVLQRSKSPVKRLHPVPKEPAFYVQVFHDSVLARRSIGLLRRRYPYARILLQSDGDDDPEYRTMAENQRCEYYCGKHLYPLEHGGRMLQRMLNDYLSGGGDWLIKMDTDTRIDRQFLHLPEDRAVYGCPLRRGPPQGGCVILPRGVAQELRDSRVFLSPLLKCPASSWGAAMAPPFLRERVEATGCIGFEWTLYWGCMQLGIPVLRHPEIHSTWKQGHTNDRREFAAVHPDKFMHVGDKPVHDLCNANHANIHTVWLEAINKST